MIVTQNTPYYDIIIIGAGHAGIEAALVATKMKTKALLITNNVNNIGALSCNPSIGGIGKGTITKEIDALGGAMGEAADRAAIHYKMLNQSKGPAVWGPRAQVDRDLYKEAIQKKI